jgi:phosphoesterase RecJ-like protein
LNWELGFEAARALYVAILTDTGGFRYSNTTARSLRIAAELIDWGIDPEEIYREVYASEPEGKIRLLSEVADTLVVDSDIGMAWITVPPGALERNRVEADHLEGIVELPRSIRGIRLAMLFRPLANGRTKVSFRSVGNVNAAGLAEQFGGGGHFKAAGASIEGDLVEVQQRVLQAARRFLGDKRSE